MNTQHIQDKHVKDCYYIIAHCYSCVSDPHLEAVTCPVKINAKPLKTQKSENSNKLKGKASVMQ